MSHIAITFTYDNITDFVTSTTNSPEESTYSASDFIVQFYICYLPVLVTIGCFGNLTSMFVFYKSRLRQQSTSVYLSALALSDTVFLCQILLPWMVVVNISELYNKNGFCQLSVYLTYVTCNLSAWLTVAFTFERFIAVIYPLRCNALCTVKRAKYVVTTLVTVALLYNIPLLIYTFPKDNNCSVNVLYIKHAARFDIIDMLWSFTVPMIFIILLNMFIIVGVYRSKRYRRRLTEGFHEQRTCCFVSIQRTTKMLLIVSTMFVVLNLPSYIMRIHVYQMQQEYYEETAFVIQHLVLLCSYTNFGINFFLYCLSGEKFRRALYQTIPWLKCGRVVPSHD